jgi:GT2 family glycosyltransferase
MPALPEISGGAACIGSEEDVRTSGDRVTVSGKFFRLGSQRWYIKGVTYGPFSANAQGHFLPEWEQVTRDFEAIRALGANAVRLYHPPPQHLLDCALGNGLRVLIDVPWEKHRCFFEDWASRRGALEAVRRAAKDCGSHSGLFALSVANEIPHDIVRFYGSRRVERFLGELIDATKQESPDCLVTYCNYPSTEFLHPAGLDFYCANVYLHDPEALGAYLRRLQHVAGTLPLVLGEHGADSIRQTAEGQATMLSGQVGRVFRAGLAGSFVFSFTDEWYAGGHTITDWAFGLTDSRRREKPAASAVRSGWEQVPPCPSATSPRVSVVVCSYNGAATLEECLDSLTALEYPNYEVILVDDGSTDQTPQIAAQFPAVRYLPQANLGLSAARNAGARAATGEIVAYTDSDCVADPAWLQYLVQAMEDQGVDAIGGPNVPPASDNWVAKCVAASPGGPSHVMFDDNLAEHVPGCNMAFRRDKLLALGGFDPQFRQAGDDVDICWRWWDAGLRIGYAPSALVWHHRRSTVGAYVRQQKGYGRSEAMLQFKHTHRFNAMGCAKWLGVIYGDGATGYASSSGTTYHGRFGASPFQIVYRSNVNGPWSFFTMLEWHAAAVFLLAMSWLSPAFAAVAAVMWLLTLATAGRAAATAPLPKGARRWCRPLIFVLHLAQPVARSWSRRLFRWRCRKLPTVRATPGALADRIKVVSAREHDLYWTSEDGLGRERLLQSLQQQALRLGWAGDFDAEWAAHDVELIGDWWHDIRIRTATEELGGPKRYTRARCALRWSGLPQVLLAASLLWGIGAIATMHLPALLITPVTWLCVALGTIRSRYRCRRAVSRLLWRAGRAAGLEGVSLVTRAQRPALARRSPTKRAEIGDAELVCAK